MRTGAVRAEFRLPNKFNHLRRHRPQSLGGREGASPALRAVRVATDCTLGDVAKYVRASLSENTRRAYAADLRHYLGWGGTLPATPKQIASYLAAQAPRMAVATLERRRAALSKAHALDVEENPARAALVSTTMRGIRRLHGNPQRQAAPLVLKDLARVVRKLGRGLAESRDRALLLMGFWGALRRSELVTLQVADITVARSGLSVLIRRSKTDPTGRGHRIRLPQQSAKQLCPKRALLDWLAASAITSGPLFQGIDRHGRIKTRRLSGEAVSIIVKRRAHDAGLDPTRYSGHSLRAGYVTTQALAGTPEWRIRRQTGHTSNGMLARYVRDDSLMLN